jgi:hypothetical protein
MGSVQGGNNGSGPQVAQEILQGLKGADFTQGGNAVILKQRKERMLRNACDQGLRFLERPLNRPHLSECLVAEGHGQFVRLPGLADLPKHIAKENLAD